MGLQDNNVQNHSFSIRTRTIKLKRSRVYVNIIHQKLGSTLSQQPATNTKQWFKSSETRWHYQCFASSGFKETCNFVVINALICIINEDKILNIQSKRKGKAYEKKKNIQSKRKEKEEWKINDQLSFKLKTNSNPKQ